MRFIRIANGLTIESELLLINVDQIASLEAYDDYSRICLTNGTFYDVGCLVESIAEAAIKTKSTDQIITVEEWR